MIAALGHAWMQRQYKSSHCGKMIKVKNIGGGPDDTVHGRGNTVTVRLVDSCDACQRDHIDLSSEAWKLLTNGHERSKVNVEWCVAPLKLLIQIVLMVRQAVHLRLSVSAMASRAGAQIGVWIASMSLF